MSEAMQHDALQGTGAAPGRVAGPAHVVRCVDDTLAVAPGSILVLRILHPHLAPLLARSAGVVVEEGALLQHATILAREFGLPAVVGVADATRRIGDRERIEIDGSSGQVRRVGP